MEIWHCFDPNAFLLSWVSTILVFLAWPQSKYHHFFCSYICGLARSQILDWFIYVMHQTGAWYKTWILGCLNLKNWGRGLSKKKITGDIISFFCQRKCSTMTTTLCSI
jgi:hypothetical protein